LKGMMQGRESNESGKGLAGWLLNRLRRNPQAQPRLALLERVTLAPRQSLALVEAEGRRFLIATSPEGAPSFYALDERAQSAPPRPPSPTARPGGRISW
jgi:hypothetical protein